MMRRPVRHEFLRAASVHCRPQPHQELFSPPQHELLKDASFLAYWLRPRAAIFYAASGFIDAFPSFLLELGTPQNSVPGSIIHLSFAIMSPRSITMADYDHEVYHTIVTPSLRAAQERFDAANAQESINTVIRDCFLRHGVEDHFSACVNHRHFDIAPHERNVESGGRAVASNDLAGIYPCTWLFHKGRLYPYEFKRSSSEEGGSLPVPPQDFVTELGLLLEERGLSEVIGLQVYTDGVVGVESTDHETNVSTTVDVDEKDAGKYVHQPSYVRASFAFFK
ncbi:hypothetical protein PWT90_09647 [Aphanocladium album]|nr:hypothetical protein PWT90_09647 [Aphanocladium album]